MKRSKVLECRDECLQCGESKAAVKESQRRRDPIYCAAGDATGGISHEWDRHRFRWTEADQAAEDAEAAHWAAMAQELETAS